MVVDVETIAEFFGITPRRVQQWADMDGMPKEAHGKYDLIKCAKWKIRKLEDECEILRNSGDEKLHDLKMRGQALSNMERETKLRKLIGQLVDMEAVRIAWTSETKNFRKACKSLKIKIGLILGYETDPKQINKLIDKEIDDMLNGLGDLKIEVEEDSDNTVTEEIV